MRLVSCYSVIYLTINPLGNIWFVLPFFAIPISFSLFNSSFKGGLRVGKDGNWGDQVGCGGRELWEKQLKGGYVGGKDAVITCQMEYNRWSINGTEIVEVPTNHWNSLRPILWERAHAWHCLEIQEPAARELRDLPLFICVCLSQAISYLLGGLIDYSIWVIVTVVIWQLKLHEIF